MLTTKFKMFHIFNYMRNNRKYKSENKPWFYEPIEYDKKKPYSIGYRTQKECAIEAHLIEAESILKKKEDDFKQLGVFISHLEYMEKNKCISLDTPDEKNKLEQLYGGCFNTIRELQTEMEELIEWYNDIIDYMEETK